MPKTDQYSLSLAGFEKDLQILVDKIKQNEIRMRARYKDIYAIPRAGLVMGVRLSHLLGIPLTNKIGAHTLVVDWLTDSGKTLKKYVGKHSIAVLYRKDSTCVEPTYCVRTINKWIIPFWEKGSVEYGQR